MTRRVVYGIGIWLTIAGMLLSDSLVPGCLLDLQPLS